MHFYAARYLRRLQIGTTQPSADSESHEQTPRLQHTTITPESQKTQMQETTAQPALPLYEDIIIANSPPIMHPVQQQQAAPATGGKFYYEDAREPSITFAYSSKPHKPLNPGNQTWFAVLEVKSSDIANIICEGFDWGETNVQSEEGYTLINNEPTKRHRWYRRKHAAWTGTRFYFLKDMLHQPPFWTAAIRIHASNASTLAHFDLNQLTEEKIRNMCFQPV